MKRNVTVAGRSSSTLSHKINAEDKNWWWWWWYVCGRRRCSHAHIRLAAQDNGKSSRERESEGEKCPKLSTNFWYHCSEWSKGREKGLQGKGRGEWGRLCLGNTADPIVVGLIINKADQQVEQKQKRLLFKRLTQSVRAAATNSHSASVPQRHSACPPLASTPALVYVLVR